MRVLDPPSISSLIKGSRSSSSQTHYRFPPSSGELRGRRSCCHAIKIAGLSNGPVLVSVGFSATAQNRRKFIFHNRVLNCRVPEPQGTVTELHCQPEPLAMAIEAIRRNRQDTGGFLNGEKM